MGFDFAAALGKVRRIVHDTFAMDAVYIDSTLAGPVPLRVRWHYKQVVSGDLEGEGYASVIDLIEKAIFDKAELTARGVTVERGARIKFIAEGFSATLIVDTKDESDSGPVDEAWRVSKAPDGGFPS